MVCCCLFESTPIEGGRFQSRGNNVFQVSMIDSSCAEFPWGFIWCAGQFIPCTMGITQYLLRRQVLQNDMSRYKCCQGYFNCCCFTAGDCGESSCPDLCLFAESCFCNSLAISASRIYVMEQYQLDADPMDYQLIRFNNCIQLMACIFDILALFDEKFRELSSLCDNLAELVYHCVSGCMTAQTAIEVMHQERLSKSRLVMEQSNIVNPIMMGVGVHGAIQQAQYEAQEKISGNYGKAAVVYESYPAIIPQQQYLQAQQPTIIQSGQHPQYIQISQHGQGQQFVTESPQYLQPGGLQHVHATAQPMTMPIPMQVQYTHAVQPIGHPSVQQSQYSQIVESRIKAQGRPIPRSDGKEDDDYTV